MDKPSFSVAVVMERYATDNRWQSESWRLAGVLPDESGSAAPVVLAEREGLLRRLHPGHVLTVFPDEAEGYYLNITCPEPRVFVMWRMTEDGADALPHSLTLSYNEAARWMDAQEKVDGVAMPSDLLVELTAWVDANYQPPAKKERIRPRSFESKDGRYKGRLS